MAVYYAMFLAITTGLGSAQADFTVCTPPNDFVNEQTCSGHTWPTVDDPVPFFPNSYLDYLVLRDMSLNVNGHYQVLPEMAVKSLSFNSISVWNNSLSSNYPEVAPAFPFKKFVQNLLRDETETLSFTYVTLNVITSQDFEGFSGLRSLALRDCHVTEIQSESFVHFATITRSGQYESRFEGLSMGYVYELQTFSWDLLLPVSRSLKNLEFWSMPKLTNITSPNHEMLLNSLEVVTMSYTALSSPLTQAIVDTFPASHADSDEGSSARSAVNFEYNKNACRRPNELLPLIEWVKETGDQHTRYLTASCMLSDRTITEYGGPDAWSSCTTPVCDGNGAGTTQQTRTTRKPTSRQTTRAVTTYNPVPSTPHHSVGTTSRLPVTNMPWTVPPPTDAPCQCDCPSTIPLTVTCSRGMVNKPQLAIDDMNTMTAQYRADSSKRCGDIGYGLHHWLVARAGLTRQRRSVSEANIVVKCWGRGEITVSELDPETAPQGWISVETAITPRCREFFLDFAAVLLDV